VRDDYGEHQYLGGDDMEQSVKVKMNCLPFSIKLSFYMN
jgi:hypothetical protein